MNDNLDPHLEGLDADRREVIKKLIATAAFVVPIVASFSTEGHFSVAQAAPYATSS
jgi:hypothetical protein